MLHLKKITSLSGRPNRNSLSKRPGLLRAGSMESSLFVAPITTTSPLLSNPSIRARRVDTMELDSQENISTGHHHQPHCNNKGQGLDLNRLVNL